MIASSGAQLLQDDAVETLIRRLFPLAAVVTPNLPEAEALTGLRGAPRRELAERLVELGAPAALVTGGHGDEAVDHLFDGHEHIELPVERHAVAATHGAGCTHSATLAALLARGLPLAEAARGASVAASAGGAERPRRDRRRRGPGRRPQPERSCMSIDPGATLGLIRERKPLIHNITNYVVMNETANAILALGALPVMAHAKDEVREMVGLAGALVLNIGTLSEDWIDAMLLAGAEANERGVPVVLDPVGAGATEYRTETAKRILDTVDVAVLRGNAGEVATLVGVEAEVRGVESVGGGGDPAELARAAASTLGVVASVTGPVDHVSDGERAAAIANGHELLAAITGTGCMSTRADGLLPRRQGRPLRSRGRGARRLRSRRRGRGRRGEGAGQLPRRALRRAGRARPELADRARESMTSS